MFVRKKPNKSGSISVQIIDKSSGKFKVVESIGVATNDSELKTLFSKAHYRIAMITRQALIDFNQKSDADFVSLVLSGINQITPVGAELVLNQLFDEIGFNSIAEPLFRHLVIGRLVAPGSKLKMVGYLSRHHHHSIDVDQVYRFMDRLHLDWKQRVENISFEHTLKLFGGNLSMVFYDVTTLYFEASDEDDLRIAGFSKDGKSQNPQIVLGLLVSKYGYPLAYEVFKGNTYEGHTLFPVIEAFKQRFSLDSIVVIADAGLLSSDNISKLKASQNDLIMGARIRTESRAIKAKILTLRAKELLADNSSAELGREDGTRLILSYSVKRSKKDLANRQRGLQKLEKALKQGKLTKQHINNRGYNKYLEMEGQINVKIDYKKFNEDAVWDGLKGYITTTKLSKEEIIEQYNHLWQIEKAFRISKTDLKIRPIFHRLKKRIEAHICLSFCSYKLYKEFERQLKEKNSNLSVERAIELLKSIYEVTLTLPESGKKHKSLIINNEQQREILNLFLKS